MARRIELRGISHDLLETFISRYNDLNGYWALGQYQAYLMNTHSSELRFNLVGMEPENMSHPFAAAVIYYRCAVLQMMSTKNMPKAWLAEGCITVKPMSSRKVSCAVSLKADLGQAFIVMHEVEVWVHDPLRELRRLSRFGPSNQKMH